MHDRLAEDLVRLAMEEAVFAVADGNPPFGAILVDADGAIVARAHNTQVSDNDPTAHAEINALRAGGARRGSPDLAGWRLVVNAEPCSMCASAIVKAGIAELVYGAPHEPHLDPYFPVTEVLARAAWPPEITAGVLAEECAAQVAAARGAADRPPVD